MLANTSNLLEMRWKHGQGRLKCGYLLRHCPLVIGQNPVPHLQSQSYHSAQVVVEVAAFSDLFITCRTLRIGWVKRLRLQTQAISWAVPQFGGGDKHPCSERKAYLDSVDGETSLSAAETV